MNFEKHELILQKKKYIYIYCKEFWRVIIKLRLILLNGKDLLRQNDDF